MDSVLSAVQVAGALEEHPQWKALRPLLQTQVILNDLTEKSDNVKREAKRLARRDALRHPVVAGHSWLSKLAGFPTVQGPHMVGDCWSVVPQKWSWENLTAKPVTVALRSRRDLMLDQFWQLAAIEPCECSDAPTKPRRLALWLAGSTEKNKDFNASMFERYMSAQA